MANYDGEQEIEAILTRLRKLCGGRVTDIIEDDNTEIRNPDGTSTKVIQFDENNEVRPYIWVDIYAPYAQDSDRILGGGEEDQPHLLSGTVECWGPTKAVTRKTAAAVRKSLLGAEDGWRAHPNNATQMVLRGGGNYRGKDSAGAPSRFMTNVPFECLINMASEPST